MAVTCKDFFRYTNRFFDYRQTIYEASHQTLKSNRVDLNLFEKFVHKEGLAAVSGPVVMAFQYYLKNDRNNCGASVNRKITTLRSYANFLQLHEVPDAEKLPFYDVLKIRRGYRKRPNALSSEQIKSLFEVINFDTILGIRDYAVYALMYQVGLRVGEVFSLNLKDIDFKNQVLTVTGKAKKVRSLHMNDELIEIVSHYLAVRELFVNSWKTGALFLSKKGNRLAIRTMEDNFKKLRERSDFHVPFNVTCHTLRHSLASHLNDNDVDILIIQSILGHASTRSSEVYIHPSQKRIRAALERLPGIIYFKELVRKGVINLSFQNRNRTKIE